MYREQLPEGCPLSTAEEVAAARVVYRLVRTDPPTDRDFASLHIVNPHRRRSRDPKVECRARGLSVWSSPEAAAKNRDLPGLSNRMICAVRLAPGAGRIERNGVPGHHTWWPLAAFEILSECSVLEEP